MGLLTPRLKETPEPGLELARTVRVARHARFPGWDWSAQVLLARYPLRRLLATLVAIAHGEDAGARTRTWDRLVNSEALYHLSYSGSPQSPVSTLNS